MEPEKKAEATDPVVVEGSTTAAMTYGQEAVGFSFNPSGDPTVAKIKDLYSQIIDICNIFRSREEATSETKRILSVAITEAQTAQMWAVKGITYKN